MTSLEKGLLLEYATLGWNVVGCVVVLVAAFSARSVALAGFGIDSVIEIFASVVVVWQLKRINKDKEVFAERLIGYAFLALAVYLTTQSGWVLLHQFHPQTSALGISWLVATAIVMFLLAYGKWVIGKVLQNPVLLKEGRVTVVDGVLALTTLFGIGINALYGIWWADPLVAFVIVMYGLKEGLHAFSASK